MLTLLCDGRTFDEIRGALPEIEISTVNAALERVCTALLAVGALYLEAVPRGS